MSVSEQWRPVVGYEGLYEVSSIGRVRSLPRVVRTRWGGTQMRPGQMLTAFVDRTSTGYRFVRLSRNGIGVKIAAHILVLEAFVGPRQAGMEACHYDGVRTHNTLQNLRWDTRRANAQDRIRHGNQARGENAGQARLTNELALWVLESRQSSKELAPILGVASSTIRALRTRTNWKHLGTGGKA